MELLKKGRPTSKVAGCCRSLKSFLDTRRKPLFCKPQSCCLENAISNVNTRRTYPQVDDQEVLVLREESKPKSELVTMAERQEIWTTFSLNQGERLIQ
jgi:hypothetical protein